MQPRPTQNHLSTDDNNNCTNVISEMLCARQSRASRVCKHVVRVRLVRKCVCHWWASAFPPIRDTQCVVTTNTHTHRVSYTGCPEAGAVSVSSLGNNISCRRRRHDRLAQELWELKTGAKVQRADFVRFNFARGASRTRSHVVRILLRRVNLCRATIYILYLQCV